MKNKKKIYVFLIILTIIFQNNSYSQSPEILWNKIYSISSDGDIDDPKSIKQTYDGGYIITGSCVPDVTTSLLDVLLLKTDPSGNIEWTRTYGKSFIEEGISVVQTVDSGYIIGGRSVLGSFPMVDPPISDTWIIKTNYLGDTLWTKTVKRFGGNVNNYCTSIVQTIDGGFIFTGTLYSEYSYPMYEVDDSYKPDSSKMWLVKIDEKGNTLWEKTYSEKSYGNSVAQTEDGGYIVLGWVFPNDENNESDVYLVKTDSMGETLWTQKINVSENDIGLCIREVSDGYVISGQSKSVNLHYDALIIKTDKAGNVIWDKIYGSAKDDAAFTVEVDDDGYFFTGTTNGEWWITAGGDVWAFKTGFDGNLLWEKFHDIRTNDISLCGIISSDGGYVVSALVSHGFGGDLWLGKLGEEPNSTKNTSLVPTDFNLYPNYPNPFNPSTTITFEIPKNTYVKLGVFDLLGNEVATILNNEISAGSYELDFDASKLSSGIYFYTLQAGNYSKTYKMVLLR